MTMQIKSSVFLSAILAILFVGMTAAPTWANTPGLITAETPFGTPPFQRNATDYDPGRGSGADIVDVAIRAGSFDILVAALTAADLVDTLKGPGPFTVFAPTDAAFAKLPPELLRSLLETENKALLTSILTYHVAAGSLTASEVARMDIVRTLNGQALTIQSRNSTVKVNNAKVILPDVFASNGVIHVIDTVLIPEQSTSSEKNLVETLRESRKFNTLLAALEAGDLLDALQGDDPLTLFAPTDAAFAMIPDRVLNDLLQPQNKRDLVAILTYHVVPGEKFSTDFRIPGYAPTLNGELLFLDVEPRSGAVLVENARLIRIDVPTSNGVIHVIDAVLIP